MTAEPQYSREQDLEQLRSQIRLKIEQARLALKSHREGPERPERPGAAGKPAPDDASSQGSMVIEGDDPRIHRRRFYS